MENRSAFHLDQIHQILRFLAVAAVESPVCGNGDAINVVFIARMDNKGGLVAP